MYGRAFVLGAARQAADARDGTRRESLAPRRKEISQQPNEALCISLVLCKGLAVIWGICFRVAISLRFWKVSPDINCGPDLKGLASTGKCNLCDLVGQPPDEGWSTPLEREK
jgi:hypothetical protein